MTSSCGPRREGEGESKRACVELASKSCQVHDSLAECYMVVKDAGQLEPCSKSMRTLVMRRYCAGLLQQPVVNRSAQPVTHSFHHCSRCRDRPAMRPARS